MLAGNREQREETMDSDRLLLETDRARYTAKLNRLQISDPYLAPGVLFKTIDQVAGGVGLPNLQYHDIYQYLINFPSHYTGESLKAYKSLEGYKWIQSGFVSEILLWHFQQRDRFVLTAKVNHSQRLNEPPLKPWAVVRRDGVVLGAHCNCTAGQGECCSHVSAVLFRLWQHNQEREEETTVTSKKCKWGRPSETAMKKVEYLQGKDIVFNHTQKSKKQTKVQMPETKKCFLPLTQSEQSQLYNGLSQCFAKDGQKTKPVALSVVREHIESYVPKTVSLQLPEPLTSLYDKNMRDVSRDELQKRAEACFEQLSVTKEQSDVVEEQTHDQQKSKMWFEQRAGRITASTFRAACKSDIRKPSVSLIKKICYPQAYSFSSEATRWGCKHEAEARQHYQRQHCLTHCDVLVEEAGFIISTTHPFTGASPDGYVSCSCCGTGVLEIKCPFCVKDLSAADAANSSSFCLEKDKDGNLRLKREHAYFYQIQMQMFVTGKSYCDFVIWTEKDSFSPYVERILPDEDFFQNEILIAEEFYKKCVLPELLGKIFTAPKVVCDNGQHWCYCREAESDTMLVCASGFCSVKRFHQTCLGIKRVPKQWICPTCRKIKSQKNS